MQAHNKTTTLALIAIVGILILSNIASATWTYVNDTTTATPANTETSNQTKGIKFTTVRAIELLNVTKLVGSTVTRARLCSSPSCSTLYGTASFSGNTASFANISLSASTTYYLVTDNSGSSYSSKYAGGQSYPQNKVNVNYDAAVYAAGTHATEQGDFLSMFTRNGTEDIVSTPIMFWSQSPSDINTNTFFTYSSVNVTYNYTILTGLTQAILNNSLITTKLSCPQVLNGTCIKQTLTTQNGNLTSGTTALISFLLTENNFLPYNMNLPEENFTNIKHNVSTATTIAEYHAIRFDNLSNETQFTILEAMVNTSGLSRIYYCNSSYDFSSLVTANSNCAEVQQFSTSTFNHTHNANSSHNVFSFSLTNGNLAGIHFTNTSYFLFRRTTGTLNLYHVPIIAQTGTFKYSPDNGNNWVNRGYTLDAHLHQYSNADYLTYTACGNYSGTFNCSTTFQNDTLNVDNLPPLPPTILIPNSSMTASAYMNITFLNATAQQPGATISYYNITLLDSLGQHNRTIRANNGLNNTYYWNVLNESLPTGTWFVKVTAYDSNNLTAFDFESFTIATNALLNITAQTALSATPINNFTVNLTDNLDSTTTSTNTTTGFALFDTIIGHNYTALIDAPGYALNDSAATRNWTQNSTYNNFTFYLYGNNSVRVFIYDETTNVLLNGFNITIVITGNSSSNTYNTTNGTFYISDLLDGTYSFSFSGGIYTLKSYSVTVADRSSQTLNAYLSTSTQTVIFTMSNIITGAPIEGANFVVTKLVNSSYIVTDTKTSDITGRIQITYIPLQKYCFTITATNYISKYFCLDPILFSTYNVNMNPSSGATNNASLERLSIVYFPTLFYDNAQNNFTFTIASPGGILETTNYSITYPNGTGTTQTIYGGNNNANGATFSINFTIQNATLQSKVIFNYSYDTVNIATPNKFSYSYAIVLQGTNYTWIDLKENLPSYNLGSFEKILIVTLAIIIVVGLGYGLGGTPAASIMGMLTLSVFSFLGFVPLLTIIPTLIIGFLFLRGTS